MFPGPAEVALCVGCVGAHISKNTLEFHYTKHHTGCIERLNQPIHGTVFARLTLEEIVLPAPQETVFNNAAQAVNACTMLMSTGRYPAGRQ